MNTNAELSTTEEFKLGDKVSIRKRNLNDAGHIKFVETLGTGVITLTTTHGAEVMGLGEEYMFHEWFPYDSRRCYIQKAA
jgi:hypothetical protein